MMDVKDINSYAPRAQAKEFESKEYKVFEMFRKDWAVVTAGTPDKFNSCVVAWGSLGTIWTVPGKKTGSTVTVYIYPTRYTNEVLQHSEKITVSFFPKTLRKQVFVLGSQSGRDTDKVNESGLTPKVINGAVTYEEATFTFVCRKICQLPIKKEDIAQDIRDYYAANPQGYPVDENGDYHPHWIFMGEIIATDGKL